MKENSNMARIGGQPAWADMMLPEAKTKEIAVLEADYEKMKQCYPPQVANIRYMVEDTCDQLEYEGSPMFDEIPDGATTHRLAQQIYDRIAKDSDADVIPCIAWPVTEQKENCRDGRCKLPDAPYDSGRVSPVMARPGCRGNNCTPPGRPDCRGRECEPPYVPDCDSGNCMLRQMIEVMLLNEMSHRRNRYRTRRW